MGKTYKPSGYNSLSPYFVVDGAQKLVDLLTEIFNAKELRRYDAPDGTIMHVEIQIDDTVVMIGDSSEQFPPNHLLVHVYVSDVDEIFDKAVRLGCIPVETPREREGDPDKRGMFKDFSGNIWAVATQSSKQL
ncbi:VOC family protein [Paenibacillus alkalitolerans]|uniref:VOC family protein n=1 Tax=Paenibacillus alkalitolerans TaxID=2799335 RepID=UPI0018F5B8DA|nr:VOC family protein [Paenibacillus alkalitolerans]